MTFAHCSTFYLLFRGLPDTDTAFFNLGKLLDRKDVTDSYVTAYLDNCRILMTSVKVRGGKERADPYKKRESRE
jgi:hypothetical protein